MRALLDRNGSWGHDRDGGWIWYPRDDVLASLLDRRVGAGRPLRLGVGGSGPVGLADAPLRTLGPRRPGSLVLAPAARWAPAWVGWAAGPGYVAWCPLDWHDGPCSHRRSAIGASRRPS